MTKLLHGYDVELIKKIIARACDPGVKNIAFDGFSGVGGVTRAFEECEGWVVVACVNHWDKAIETHSRNFPYCLHMLEDFRTADLAVLKYIIDEVRRFNPCVRVHLHFSLECTNFSNAKGGLPRDNDSRTLADFTDRYVIALNPDVIWVENVREFTLWGPMIPKVISLSKDKNKKVKKQQIFVPFGMDESEYYDTLIMNGHVLTCPLVVKKRKTKKNKLTKRIEVIQEAELQQWPIPNPYYKGQDFHRWTNYMCSFGYKCSYRLFNCADYGVPQHRIRLIMNFVRDGLQTNWPKATHSKTGKDGLPFWIPVKTCLDLDDEGTDILSFNKQKKGKNGGKLVPRIKSPKTIERLINGCKKQVIEKNNPNFLTQWYSDKSNSKNKEINDVSGAVTATGGNMGIVKVDLLHDHLKAMESHAVNFPDSNDPEVQKLHFLGTYHSTGDGSGIESACPAIMTKDKYPLFTTQFIDQQFSSGQTNKSITEASGAILSNPKQHVVSVGSFIMDTQFNNESKSLDTVSRTITANRKHYYLVNFQWYNTGFSSIDQVSNTILARLDKVPTYLVVLETGQLAIEIYKHDPPHYVKFKKFMADNAIISCKMRMLKEDELLKIMTLDDHILTASATDNKKMIGNAVPPKLMVALAKAFDEGNGDIFINEKAA